MGSEAQRCRNERWGERGAESEGARAGGLDPGSQRGGAGGLSPGSERGGLGAWRALPPGGSGRELSCPPAGSKAEVRLSVPPLVEVMRGESVTLDCSPLGTHDHFMLEWFLVSAVGWEGGRDRGGPKSQGAVGLQTFIPSSEPESP